MITTNLSSAIGGLNISDPLDNMEPQYAIQMDNIIPEPTGDVLRNGFVEVITGTGYAKLLSINIAGDERLVACTDTTMDIYDVSNFETAPTTISNLSSANWSCTQFTDGSGVVHIFFANNLDKPLDYTTLGGMQQTSLTTTGFNNLDCPLSFKNRLYFISGDFELAYTGIQSISGSLTKFEMGSFFKKGGKLVNIANWTQDAGQGVDDLLCLISSEGEVMIYSGTDPSANDWKTLGVFQIPKPIGKNCSCLFGADLVVITEKGYFSLSNVLSNLRANRSGISQKVDGITKGRSTTKQWEIHFSPKRGWLIINAPSNLAGYNYEQHVLNMATNGWCRFVGMDGTSWAEVKDRLFFCNGDGIFEADVGTTDNGNFIIYNLQRAYNQFGYVGKKQLMEIDPKYYAETSSYLEMFKRINVDFQEGEYRVLSIEQQNGNFSEWDDAIWDDAFWSDEFTAFKFRGRVVSKAGNYISIGYYGRAKTGLTFYSMGLIIKEGRGHI